MANGYYDLDHQIADQVAALQAAGGIASVFGRAGPAITAQSGDYTAAQVTGAADTSSVGQQAFTGEVKAPDIAVSGLTGSVSASRYVGATASGAPTTGVHSVGDWVTDLTGKRWTCTTAGTPGTWTQEPGTAASLPTVTLESQGAVGDGTTDDTAAFRACANLGAVRITGTHATYKVTGTITPGVGNYWDMWGISVSFPTTGIPFLSGGSSDGVTFRKGFTWMGGTITGPGQATTSNHTAAGFNLLQWTDSRIIGVEISGFADSATMQRSCRRVMMAFTYCHDCCTAAGQNLHNITDFVPNGMNQASLEAVFIGNVTDGNIPTAPMSINATNGGYLNIDTLCSFNVLETTSGFTCVFSEINSYNARTDTATVTNASATVTDASILAGDLGRPVTGTGIPANTYVGTVTAGVSFLLSSSSTSQVNVNATAGGTSVSLWSASANRRVIVSDNLLINTSTGSAATCFYALDDGPNNSNDPLKLADHQVDNNIMVCASNSTANSGGGVIQFAGSRFSFTSNEIIAAGTNGRCVLFKPGFSADPAVYSDIQFANNNLYQTNTAATSRMVELNGSNSGGLVRVKWSGGSLVSSITAQAVTTADAFWVGGNGVSNWTIENVHIENAGNNAFNLVSPKDYRIRNCTIHNPNSCNTAGTGAGNGITITGTAVGTRNRISGVDIYDDRGTHQMLFGLNFATATTKARVTDLSIYGALTLPMTTTTIANGIASLRLYDSDVYAGYGLNNSVANTAGASPFTIGPFATDATVILRAVNGQTQFQIQQPTTSNLQNVNGVGVVLKAGFTIISTWATTAPTYDLINYY